jgi:outer membrane protein assembly factor BamB
MTRPTSLLLSLCVLSSAAAADWPQWRGAGRDGVSPETVAAWPEDGPPVKWKHPFGEGHSSPVVADGKVFVLSKSGDDEVVTALDAATGERKWEHKYPAPFTNQFGNGPRGTPTYDAGKLYTLGATGKLHCFDAATGKVIWSVDTFAEFRATNLFFGVSTSPLVDGPRLLVNVGGKGASVVAFDKADGKVLWKAGDDRASYASPQIVRTPAAGTQVVFVTFREVLSVAPADGKVLWKIPLKTRNDENAVTPLAFGDTVIVSSVSGGLLALRPTPADGVHGVETVWHNKDVSCYFSSPVLVGGRIFAVHGAPAKLTCLDAATGKVLWSEPNIGLLHASLLAAGDHLLMLNDVGKLYLLDARGRKYRELADPVKVCAATWVHPALADGRLYVKDAVELRCLEMRGGK